MSFLEAISLKFIELTATSVIRFKNGKASCTKGTLPTKTLRDVEDILAEQGVEYATLGKSGPGKWSFSNRVPKEAHQRLRNVLTNH